MGQEPTVLPEITWIGAGIPVPRPSPNNGDLSLDIRRSIAPGELTTLHFLAVPLLNLPPPYTTRARGPWELEYGGLSIKVRTTFGRGQDSSEVHLPIGQVQQQVLPPSHLRTIVAVQVPFSLSLSFERQFPDRHDLILAGPGFESQPTPVYVERAAPAFVNACVATGVDFLNFGPAFWTYQSGFCARRPRILRHGGVHDTYTASVGERITMFAFGLGSLGRSQAELPALGQAPSEALPGKQAVQLMIEYRTTGPVGAGSGSRPPADPPRGTFVMDLVPTFDPEMVGRYRLEFEVPEPPAPFQPCQTSGNAVVTLFAGAVFDSTAICVLPAPFPKTP